MDRRACITDEIERLLYVVSGALRNSWETHSYGGESLQKVQKIRTENIALIRKLKKRSLLAGILGLTLFVLCFLTSVSTQRWLTGHSTGFQVDFLIATLAPGLVCILLKIRYDVRVETLRCKLYSDENILESFGRSVDALNIPDIRMPSHDIVTESSIQKRGIELACRILGAKKLFDFRRLDPEADIYDVIHFGNCVEEHEKAFDQFWKAATKDFGLKLDKARMFESAAAELAKKQS